eukprot:g2932.t1
MNMLKSHEGFQASRFSDFDFQRFVPPAAADFDTNRVQAGSRAQENKMAAAAPVRYSSRASTRTHAHAHAKPQQPVVVEQFSTGPNGERQLARQFEKQHLLGKGGFAKCYQFRDLRTGKYYAGKIIAKSQLKKSKAKEKLHLEIKLHKDLNHRRVVKMKTWFEDSLNAYIVLELCPNLCMSQLVKRRKRLTEYEARFYMLQIIEGVQFLHAASIIHRDLKLGNIFLDSGMNIKLGDFGLAAKLDYPGQRKKTICGTPNYIAPEILEGKNGHGPPVDIWSMGVILYTFIIGRPPYETTDVKATYRRIRKNQYVFPAEKPMSGEAKALVRRILKLQPDQRPSLESMRGDVYFTHGQIPRAIPKTALKIEPRFTSSDMCAPALSARRPLEPRPTLHVNAQPAEHRVLKVSAKPNAEERASNGEGRLKPRSATATSTGQPQTARPALGAAAENRPAHQLKAAPHTARERQAPRPALAPAAAGHKAAVRAAFENDAPAPAAATGATDGGTKRAPVEQRGTTSARAAAGRSQKAHAGATAPPVEKWATTTATAAAMSVAAKSKAPSVLVPPPAQAGAVVMPASQAMVGTLETMHQQLALSFANGGAAAHTTKVAPEDESLVGSAPQLWVTKWVDYTSKYGLGYLLNDGSSGVYFNDSTKIILATNNANFEYMERSKRSSGRAVDPPRQAHTLETFPGTLQKKVTLLKHFRNYLIEQQVKAGSAAPVAKAEDPKTEMVFLKKWVRTRHAILFRLSNRTALVFATPRLFLDKKGNRTTHPLHQVMASSRPDIAKRLKYTKDILHQLISGERK